jgi:hypothetical protein
VRTVNFKIRLSGGPKCCVRNFETPIVGSQEISFSDSFESNTNDISSGQRLKLAKSRFFSWQGRLGAERFLFWELHWVNEA